MKKLFVLGVFITLLVTSATAQRTADRIRKHRIERSFDRGQLTRPEKFRLERNLVRHKIERRRALRDGRVTPMERRKLQKTRRHDRREMFRFKHNSRRRLI